MASLAQPKTQRATVAWGPDLNERETGEFNRVFSQSADAVYMILNRKKELLVQKMNGALQSQYSKVLSLEWDKKDLELEDLTLVGDRILAFASFHDKKEHQRTLCMRTFGESNMSPEGSWTKLVQFDSRKASSGSFGVEVSPNRKHVLVYINLPYEKDAPEKFKLHVFSASMTPEWDREITLPYTDKEFRFEDYRVDNKGDALLIGVKYAEKREAREKKRAGKSHYDYHILTYSGSGSDQDHTIKAGDRFLQDLTLSLDTGNAEILCGGFYGVKGESKVRGAFFLSLDPVTKAVKHESYKAFTDDFITQYMTAKEESKAKKKAERKDEELELYEYELSDIVRRDDGGAVLVGEQVYTYTTTTCYTTQGGGQQCTTTFHYIYNDIIVVNIDPKGDIQWATTIPKRQHTANDGGFFSSYGLAVKGSNLYFVYNDNGENLFLSAGDKFKRTDFQGKSSIVTLATVSIDGHVTREALFDPEKRDLILRPKSCRQLEDDRMFLYATRKKDYKFGMVSFL
ncbi:MAG: hypothetical protein IPM46_06605 [Flavobacteriales bacterium]|nr:hypothetical protein [Flavobacteriales bacterium]